MSVWIARCPDHGLHGERDECFVCGGPVEQVEMIEAGALERCELTATGIEVRVLRELPGEPATILLKSGVARVKVEAPTVAEAESILLRVATAFAPNRSSEQRPDASASAPLGETRNTTGDPQ